MPKLQISLPKLLCTAVCVSVLAACGSSNKKSVPVVTAPPPPPPPIVAQEFDYQNLLDMTVTADIPGVVLEIKGPDIDFIGSAGLADIDSQENMQTYHQIPAGSAGKKATTLLVAMMHDQGILNVDDKITTWLPDTLLSQIPHSDKMTLRQLLMHTAGIHDYLDDSTADNWFSTAFSDPDTLKTDIYALQFALNQAAYFEPGTGYKYSNTGYLLAGLILDTILGEHHYKALRSMIIEPLGLNDTYYSGLEREMGSTASGYTKIDGNTLNTKPFYYNVGVADAPLVSTASDLNTLLRAIIKDTHTVNDDIRETLLGDQSMTDLGNDVYYGLGLFKDIIQGFTVYHHGGEEAGYKTANIYIEELDTGFSMLFNCHGYTECNNQSDAVVQLVLAELIKAN